MEITIVQEFDSTFKYTVYVNGDYFVAKELLQRKPLWWSRFPFANTLWGAKCIVRRIEKNVDLPKKTEGKVVYRIELS